MNLFYLDNVKDIRGRESEANKYDRKYAEVLSEIRDRLLKAVLLLSKPILPN